MRTFIFKNNRDEAIEKNDDGIGPYSYSQENIISCIKSDNITFKRYEIDNYYLYISNESIKIAYDPYDSNLCIKIDKKNYENEDHKLVLDRHTTKKIASAKKLIGKTLVLTALTATVLCLTKPAFEPIIARTQLKMEYEVSPKLKQIESELIKLKNQLKEFASLEENPKEDQEFGNSLYEETIRRHEESEAIEARQNAKREYEASQEGQGKSY